MMPTIVGRLKRAGVKFGHWSLVVSVVCVSLASSVSPASAAEQEGYRWRNDDGSMTAATWSAPVNSAAAVVSGQNARLQMNVSNPANDTELRRLAASAFSTPPSQITAGASSGKYAYFSAYTTPGLIVRIDLDSFETAGILTLEDGENTITALYLDSVHSYGYALSINGAGPGRIIKFRLSDFTRVGAITLNEGENGSYALTGDAVHGFLYAGDFDSTTVTKVSMGEGDDAPSRIGAIVLPVVNGSGINYAVADSSGDYVYVGASGLTTDQASVVRIATATFAADGVLQSGVGSTTYWVMKLDEGRGYGYFEASGDNVSIVNKVRLSDFTMSGTLTLPVEMGWAYSMVLDVTNGYGYVASLPNDEAGYSLVAKFSFGSGDADPAMVGSPLTTSIGGNGIWADSAGTRNGYVMFASNNSPAQYIRIRLSDFTEAGTISYTSGGEASLVDMDVDVSGGLGYTVTSVSPGKLIKFRTGDLSSVSATTLDAGDGTPVTARLDAARQYAYILTSTKLVKVRVSDMTVVGSATLYEGSVLSRSLAVDSARGFAYVQYYGSGNRLERYSLGTGDAAPAFSSSIDLGTGAHYMVLAMAPNGQYLYSAGESYLARVKLSDFSADAYAALSLNGMVADRLLVSADGAAAFGSASAIQTTDHSEVFRVNLSTMTQTHHFSMPDVGQAYLAGASSSEGRIYVTDASTPAKVYRYSAADLSADGSISLAVNENDMKASYLDESSGLLYLGANTDPGRLVKVAVTPHWSLRLEYAPKVTTCAAASGWTKVANAGGWSGEDWQMSPSSYFDDGAIVTAVSGAPYVSGKTFSYGVAMDSLSDSLVVGAGGSQYTAVEYSLKAISGVEGNYCFRLTDEGVPLADGYATYAEASVAPASQSTTDNAVTLSRLATSATADLSVSYGLQRELTGVLTVTLPTGFTVLSPFTGGVCSGGGSIGSFDREGMTLTASKLNCSGTVTLTGATVQNPATPGEYSISWVNDDPGSAQVVIVADDTIDVSAVVDPSISFEVGARSSCNGTFVADDWTVELGRLSGGHPVASSGTDGVQLICTRLSTNATDGAVVTVRNNNGADGLVSASALSDSIPNAAAPITSGTPNYGLCYSTVSGDVDYDHSASPAASAPETSYGSYAVPSCTGSIVSGEESVGALSKTATEVWRVSNVTSGAYAALRVKASISATQPAHNDYQDALIFAATATY